MVTKKDQQEFPADSAARVMVDKDKVPMVSPGTSVLTARKQLQVKSKKYSSINYLYVVDQQKHLKGLVSIKELLFQEDESVDMEKIMQTEVVSARPHTPQERAGLLALRHSIKSLPIVDKNGKFLGVIPFDVILKILDKEAVEDYLRLGGISFTGKYDDFMKLPVLQSIQHRLPWLLVGLLGGFLVAGIIGGFEEALSRYLILAAFIPLVVYMAGAVGTQMTTFIVRDLMLNPDFSFIKYFLKQFLVTVVIAFILSSLLWTISVFVYQVGAIGWVLGVGMFFAIVSSVFSGLVVPYVFSKFKLDPANAAGPVATIIQDILSVLVYFVVATQLLP